MLRRVELVFGCVFLLLFAVIGAFFNAPLAVCRGTIYIRADGSVEPPTAPISSSDNVTYILTADIYDSISIEKNNVVVDGRGYAVHGTGTGSGIVIERPHEASNVTITNMVITAFDYGVYLCISSRNSISGNNISGNIKAGIFLIGSWKNNVTGNNITTNEGIGIKILQCTGNNISGNNIGANSQAGVELSGSWENHIIRNNISNNEVGINLVVSSDNSIYHNNFVDNSVQACSPPAQAYNHLLTNAWEENYPSGGNYWSDYVGVDSFSGPYQNLTGSDGIGDTPYTVDEDNRDRYPLMSHWADSSAGISSDPFPPWLVVTVIAAVVLALVAGMLFRKWKIANRN